MDTVMWMTSLIRVSLDGFHIGLWCGSGVGRRVTSVYYGSHMALFCIDNLTYIGSPPHTCDVWTHFVDLALFTYRTCMQFQCL